MTVYDDQREERDKLIIEAAKEAALVDWEDQARAESFSEIPACYLDAPGAEYEIWWEAYHLEYDRIVAERGE